MQITQRQQTELFLERIKILYGNASHIIFGSTVAGLIIFYLIWHKLPHNISIIWLLINMLPVPLRIGLYFSFKAQIQLLETNPAKQYTDIEIWEQRWLIVTSLQASFLVVSAYLPYPEDEQLIILLLISVILVGLVAGNIVSTITSLKTTLTFISIMIIPYTVRCFMEDSRYFLALGYFFIAFYAVFCMLALRMNQTVLNSIKQQIERHDLSNKDSLTNLWNRRKLFSYLNEIKGQNYGLMMIDVDHFKQYNDKHGHKKGDDMLYEISQSIVNAIDPKNLVVRYGGEEFLVVLPKTSTEHMLKIAERVRAKVHLQCNHSVSIGLISNELQQDFDILVDQADKAMYQAKQDGRNCVRTAAISA